MATISKGATRRTTKRLARIRVANPKALPRVKADNKYTPRERRKVLKAAKALPKPKGGGKGKPAKKKVEPYNPLAPLTGKAANQEMRAAEKAEFGPQRQEIIRQQGYQQQTAANVASYYDDYKAALAAAGQKIDQANAGAVGAQEARVDSVNAQENQRVATRDAQAAEQARKLGFTSSGASAEGAQAVQAARSQGVQQVGAMRTQAAADTAHSARREATSVQGKAEALTKEAARGRELQQKRQDIATARGAWRTNYRRQTRKDEREYAAIRKEFGLKEAELKQDARSDRESQKTDRMQANAQKIVAKIYASADRAGARAQVRVAKLQLEKGKISKRQYRHIVNEYKGLPAKGKSGGSGSGSGSGGGADGGKPTLQTWEKDKVSNAVRVLDKQNAKAADKRTWMKRMQDEGVPARLARVAWARYVKQFKTIDRPGNAPGPKGQGSRPT